MDRWLAKAMVINEGHQSKAEGDTGKRIRGCSGSYLEGRETDSR